MHYAWPMYISVNIITHRSSFKIHRNHRERDEEKWNYKLTREDLSFEWRPSANWLSGLSTKRDATADFYAWESFQRGYWTKLSIEEQLAMSLFCIIRSEKPWIIFHWRILLILGWKKKKIDKNKSMMLYINCLLTLLHILTW